VLCLSELAANAVRHSASRHPGGTFTVSARIHPGSHVHIEVTDSGDGQGLLEAADQVSGVVARYDGGAGRVGLQVEGGPVLVKQRQGDRDRPIDAPGRRPAADGRPDPVAFAS